MNKSISLENKKDYINEKKKEIESLDQSILSIENKIDELEKISFLNNYLSILESHLLQLQSVFTDMNHYQKELKNRIDTMPKTFSHKDFFIIQDKTFHISYSKDTYTFFAQVGYDDYYAMDTYMIFSYNLENKTCIQENIGYTDKPMILLQNPLQVIEKNLYLMDDTHTIDELQGIAFACEELLTTLFAVESIREIDDNDTMLETFYSCSPKKIIQLHRRKKEDHTIRIQLEKKKVKKVSPELITLIKVESNYMKYHNDKPLLGDDFSEELAAQLLETKEQLLSTVNMNQNELDKLLALIH